MEAHRNRKNAALGNYHLSFSIYNRYYVGYPPAFSPQQFEETQPRHTELGQDQSYTPEKTPYDVLYDVVLFGDGRKISLASSTSSSFSKRSKITLSTIWSSLSSLFSISRMLSKAASIAYVKSPTILDAPNTT